MFVYVYTYIYVYIYMYIYMYISGYPQINNIVGPAEEFLPRVSMKYQFSRGWVHREEERMDKLVGL